jgi:adhesin transport system outer membrane protein
MNSRNNRKPGRTGLRRDGTGAALGLALALCAGAALAQAPAPAAAPAYGAAAPAAFQNLRQAVNEAVLRNPNRIRAGHEVTGAGYQRDAAQWGRFPTLSVEATPASGNSSSRSLSATIPQTVVRIDQPLWAGGRIEGQIDAARAQLSASELADAESRRRIAEDTAVAYVGWLRAAERVEIARAGAEQLQTLLRYVQRRETDGVASSADVAIATGRYSQGLAQVSEMRGALERARAELENLVTLPAGRGTQVTVPVYPERRLADIEEAYLSNSHLVAQRRAEADAARAQVAVRQGQMLPRVSVRAEHLTYDNKNNGTGLSNNDTRVMLSVQFSPEAGLSSYSNVQAAGSKVESALAQVTADENDVRLRARANWADYNSGRQQVGDFEPQVNALETASSSFMRQFEAGRKSWVDVLNTHRETTEAKISLSRARGLREQSALRLMANTGSFWSWLEALPQ